MLDEKMLEEHLNICKTCWSGQDLVAEKYMNKIIRNIMKFINKHKILWNFFTKFDWYKKALRRQAHNVLMGK